MARVDFFDGATLIGSAVSSAEVPITVNAPASAGLMILYLHADHLGTPRVATDDSQTIV